MVRVFRKVGNVFPSTSVKRIVEKQSILWCYIRIIMESNTIDRYTPGYTSDAFPSDCRSSSGSFSITGTVVGIL